MNTMHKSSITVGVLAGALWALAALPARADFHFWYIQEIFTNHNGSVQFIELFTTFAGQQNLAPTHSIDTTISDPFPFPNDSPTPTNNHHLLLATAGFESIAGGALPDYTIPSNFFSTTTDTINFGPGANIRTFASIPTDGINSLNYTSTGVLTTTANTPRNFAGTGASVNLPPPVAPTGDYNGNHVVDAADYIVWRDTLTQSATPTGSGADGNANGTIEVGDYTFWRERFGNATGSGSGLALPAAVPEPSAGAMLLIAAVAIHFGRRLR